MHLARVLGIQTAEHSLIRLQSGELAYITKRFDRIKGEKLAVEDMCQLTETLTNDKYRGSMEKIGKQIEKFSSRPGLDLITFFEVALFSFLTGNADMHLKNFSLLTTPQNEIVFSPAYDMLCTKIPVPDDQEEMALTINAKKRKLKKSDFDLLAGNLALSEKVVQNVYLKFSRKLKELMAFIDISFLPDEMKEAYKKIMEENSIRIGLR